MAAFAVAFAIVPSVIFGDTNLSLVLLLTLVPWLAFSLGEWLVERTGHLLDFSGLNQRYLNIYAVLTLGLALIGHLVAALNNVGSVAEARFGYEYSQESTLSRQLMALTIPALMLLILSFASGGLSRRMTLILSISLVLGSNIRSVMAGYLGGATAAWVTLLVAGTLVGLFKRREIVAATAAVVIAIPTLFVLRDDVRVSVGLQRSSLSVGPFERFRVDTLISQLDSASSSLGMAIPDLGLALRTAFIPRILDPGRPTFNLGPQIDIATGGSGLNNHTFGHYGTVYWLLGLGGVIVVALTLGLLFGVGVRHFNHIWGVLLLGTVLSPSVWTETSFPNYWISGVQVLLSCGVLALIAGVIEAPLRKREKRKTPERSGST